MESKTKTDYLVNWQIIGKDGKIKEEGNEKLNPIGKENGNNNE